MLLLKKVHVPAQDGDVQPFFGSGFPIFGRWYKLLVEQSVRWPGILQGSVLRVSLGYGALMSCIHVFTCDHTSHLPNCLPSVFVCCGPVAGIAFCSGPNPNCSAVKSSWPIRPQKRRENMILTFNHLRMIHFLARDDF